MDNETAQSHLKQMLDVFEQKHAPTEELTEANEFLTTDEILVMLKDHSGFEITKSDLFDLLWMKGYRYQEFDGEFRWGVM